MTTIVHDRSSSVTKSPGGVSRVSPARSRYAAHDLEGSGARPLKAARVQLQKADLMMAMASSEGDINDQFLMLYLSALKGAGALLAVRETGRRGRSGSAWLRMDKVAPDFSDWSELFQQWSVVRTAIEAGNHPDTHPSDVHVMHLEVQRFLNEVEGVVGDAETAS